MLKKYELKKKWYNTLISCCKKNDIKFISSPFDISSIHFLEKLKLNYIKIPSGEIDNYPYLKEIAALKKRMLLINKEITLLCCDNIRENGVMLKKCLKQYVENSKELKSLDWIEKKVSFPSCVGDRITPRAPDYLRSEVNEKFDIEERI